MSRPPDSDPPSEQEEAQLPTSAPVVSAQSDTGRNGELGAAPLGPIELVPSTAGLAHVGKRGSRITAPTADCMADSVSLTASPPISPDSDNNSEREREAGRNDDASSTSSGTSGEERQSPVRVEDDAGTPVAANGKQPHDVEDSQETSSVKAMDEDEDESAQGEEDEEEEPTLKYQRLGGDTAQLLAKDSVSALAVSTKYIAMGMHSGGSCILDHSGKTVKKYRAHTAMINDMCFDTGSDYVASASMDGKSHESSGKCYTCLIDTRSAGKVFVQPLKGGEQYMFDLKRPMKCVSLDPHFGKRNTMQLVSGGMAGKLIMHEKGWLGHKETVLHSGEGPIWATAWSGTLIAWANDAGVRIYDTTSARRITYISRAEDSPRADLFKCTLYWQDEHTLLIAWADFIKVVSVREKEGRRANLGVGPHVAELFAEVSSIFQVDCMISGIAPFDNSYLILAMPTDDTYDDEATDDREAQRRKAANRPELRIISQEGEELSSDAIGLRNFEKYQCRDYSLRALPKDQSFLVISPQDIVVAQARDEVDHVNWLIEQELYGQALAQLEKNSAISSHFDIVEIGQQYLQHLVDGEQWDKAAKASPRVLGINAKRWEDWVFLYAEREHLDAIVPFVPLRDPQLNRLVYELILVHFLRHDEDKLLEMIRSWPHDIYEASAVIHAVRGQLDRRPKSTTLRQILADLYISNKQPGKALPYLLELRSPGVFNLVRQNALFTDIQDQVLPLVEFDQELQKQSQDSKGNEVPERWTSIELLVDHIHAVPVARVVKQLERNRNYLFKYLDALFDRDPHLISDYSDLQVDLYAEFNPNKLMDFLRSSSLYSLEKAYEVCDKNDLVPEMVFLLGRMGDNRRALNLIIDRLGDVQRAVDFAKEQNDAELWEDLLKYSETRPNFIRGLLDNVGPEIEPIKLIRRIQNGLEIPGLKPALIKILQDFNLQVSLMEGCKNILYSDCRDLALRLHDAQTNGFLWTGETVDHKTNETIFPHLAGGSVPDMMPFGVRFFCNHTYSSQTAFPTFEIPSNMYRREHLIASSLFATRHHSSSELARSMSDKFQFMSALRRQVDEGGFCRACQDGVSTS
ncbi:Vacuolar protein sorting-associated protein 41 [Microbotryomycetes sp. JL201]|nr:Vacuolar protein sorting-associated protein 41 [Microbotryomycetes sp. JL201]